jgi:hypothetical protein
MGLFTEASIPFFGDKQHFNPIVPGVTRNLFSANAGYFFQKYALSCRAIYGQARSGLPRATYFRKGYSEKKISAFHLRAFTSLSPAVFSA